MTARICYDHLRGKKIMFLSARHAEDVIGMLRKEVGATLYRPVTFDVVGLYVRTDGQLSPFPRAHRKRFNDMDVETVAIVYRRSPHGGGVWHVGSSKDPSQLVVLDTTIPPSKTMPSRKAKDLKETIDRLEGVERKHSMTVAPVWLGDELSTFKVPDFRYKIDPVVSADFEPDPEYTWRSGDMFRRVMSCPPSFSYSQAGHTHVAGDKTMQNWNMNVSSRLAIDFNELADSVTRDQPLAFVTREEEYTVEKESKAPDGEPPATVTKRRRVIDYVVVHNSVPHKATAIFEKGGTSVLQKKGHVGRCGPPVYRNDTGEVFMLPGAPLSEKAVWHEWVKRVLAAPWPKAARKKLSFTVEYTAVK